MLQEILRCFIFKKENDIIIFIPNSHFFTPELALKDKNIVKTFSMLNFESEKIKMHEILTYKLLIENNNKNSDWKFYFDTLPTEYDSIPYFFNNLTSELLEGCSINGFINYVRSSKTKKN